jgi:hypothetical protein
MPFSAPAAHWSIRASLLAGSLLGAGCGELGNEDRVAHSLPSRCCPACRDRSRHGRRSRHRRNRGVAAHRCPSDGGWHSRGLRYRHYRRPTGAMGIGLQDTEKHAAAVMRIWEFFRAPLLACVLCMHRDLGPWDAMSVGMFLQTLLLALTERGLGPCVEVSVVGYPEIVRGAGYPGGAVDPVRSGGRLFRSRVRRQQGRQPIGENAVFLDS